MKCLYCQARMTKGTATFHVDRKDCHLTLDKVPAWVCSQCGEPYFDEGVRPRKNNGCEPDDPAE